LKGKNMPLSTALNIAQNSLFSVTRRVGVVARNVTEAGNENYARRIALTESNSPGTRVTTIRRAVDIELARANRQAISSSSAQETLASRLDELQTALNGPDGAQSHTALLSELHNRLQTWSASPSNALLANSALEGAKQVAATIRNGSGSVQAMRGQADAEIAGEVSRLNGLLSRFQEVNSGIVNGTLGGRDVNDLNDVRDGLLKDIATIVPISTITRPGDDLMLITSGGATLFETVPRKVSFTPVPAYAAGMSGNGVRVDGVPLAAGTGINSSAAGSIAALMQLRDDVAVDIQAQLDEVARGLVETFAERDPSGGALPALAGLFTWTGAPALPPLSNVTTGMAASLTVNAAFDPAFGGSMMLLRDGGANGAAYIENLTGAASFADRLIGFGVQMETPMSFDPAVAIGGQVSLLSYSSQASGWLDGLRSDASTAAAAKDALSTRLAEKLSNATGVNIDEEMAQLVELEHSYEASSRIIKAVDEMLASLLSAVR
jgi:flagellar hook-associated protein 1